MYCAPWAKLMMRSRPKMIAGQAQQRVERPVDEAEQQLPEQHAQRNAEYESHGSPPKGSPWHPAAAGR